MYLMKRRTHISLFVTLFLCIVALLLFIFIPRKQKKMLSAVCRVDATACYAVALSGGDTLYLSLRGDSLQDAALRASVVAERKSQSGAFVSNVGDVLTSDGLVGDAADSLSATKVKSRLLLLDTLLHHRLEMQQSEQKELDYYARTHTVIDDGYNDVMTYREVVKNRTSQTTAALQKVKQLLQQKHLPVARLFAQISVRLPQSGDSLKAYVKAHCKGLLLVRLSLESLPKQCSRFSVYRWVVHESESSLYAFNDFGSCSLSQSPMVCNKKQELFAATEGGVWINNSGHISGVQRQGGVVSSQAIAKLMQQVHSWPMWWLTNLVAFAKNLSFDTDKVEKKYVHANLRCTTFCLPDSTIYKGEVSPNKVNGHAMRHGYGVLMLQDSTQLMGVWQNDSLPQGERHDAKGVYVGKLNKEGLPNGQGGYYSKNGEYYDGEWKDGVRSGHGFSSKGQQMVRCGSWKNNRFQGERMIYTADRVYGIDLSRYQHEKGRKRYTIDWGRLRITSLGADRRIRGSVDYPVSFVYIKSTEGRSMYNKYYAADLRQARAHGIAVGSYHFFTPTSSGAQQAAYFLKMSWIAASDLPPVLDLEPTAAQIKKMGGDAAMFRQVLDWLRIVEKRRGKRPVLYVSQLFVNKHLKNAPSALRNYDVWIARYGEFKPYVRLLHWQVSPYGRVRGIKTEVDVNVFNGTRADFLNYKNKGSF